MTKPNEDPEHQPSAWRPATQIVHAGRATDDWAGLVNPPIERGSTILHAELDDLFSGKAGPTYGRSGHKAQRALEAALAAIEGGAGAQLASSGLGAATLAILAAVKTGDDVLAPDCLYGPTRRFCERFLPRMGVSARFYDPRLDGAGVAALFQANTALVMMESPGSLTFEVQDCPAIAAAARARAIATLIDNTWSAGVFFKPFAHGIDLSVQAATKYQVGHADALMGAVIARDSAWEARVKDTARLLGVSIGPEDAYLCLRGLRTMGVRLNAHETGARLVAAFLAGHRDVVQLLCPFHASDPYHRLWARDFTGASGLFAFELPPTPRPALAAFFRAMHLFGRGFSWGGYESLAIPAHFELTRTASAPRVSGPIVRVHIGLEDPRDLIADLEAAFAARRQALG